MDPNTALAEALACARAVASQPGDITADALELAQRLEELDSWLSSGGFLPARWQPQPPNEADA